MSREARDDSGGPRDLSASEVAKIMGVSVRTVYRQLNLFLETNGQEGLRGYKVGRLWRVPEVALVEYRTRSPKPISTQPLHLAVRHAQSRGSAESLANPLAEYIIDKGGEIVSDLATIMTELGVDGPTLNQWIIELMKAGLLRQTGFMWKLIENPNPVFTDEEENNGH